MAWFSHNKWSWLNLVGTPLFKILHPVLICCWAGYRHAYPVSHEVIIIIMVAVLAIKALMEDEYLLSSETKRTRQKRGCLRRLWHKSCCRWLPARYVLAVMMFLGIVDVYILRVNLGVALVVMVNKTDGDNHSDIQPHPVRYVCKTSSEMYVSKRSCPFVGIQLDRQRRG